jgi:hypothetical protein
MFAYVKDGIVVSCRITKVIVAVFWRRRRKIQPVISREGSGAIGQWLADRAAAVRHGEVSMNELWLNDQVRQS